jgi:hypothetical protein
MAQRNITICLFIIEVFFGLGCAWAMEDACKKLLADIETKRSLVADYRVVLKGMQDPKDKSLISAINDKLSELTREIELLEEEAKNCPKPLGQGSKEGLGQVKSDEARFTGKSCTEMKRSLVKTLRKIYVLKRREKSLFSELSETERTELIDLNEELRLLRIALKAKCPAKSGPAPRRLR